MRWSWMLVIAVCLAAPALAQITTVTASDIASESHYRLLLKNDQVRVFSLSLRTNDQAFVRHDHNFLTVVLKDCDAVMWSEGQSPIQSYHFNAGDLSFALGGGSSGIRNDRIADCAAIVVEFLDPKVTNYGYQADTGTYGYGYSGGVPRPADPHAKFISSMTLGAAVASDVQLLPRDTFPAPERPSVELLIPVTDVDFKMESDIHTRKSSGDVLWIAAGRKSDLFNAASEPIRFTSVRFPTDAK